MLEGVFDSSSNEGKSRSMSSFLISLDELDSTIEICSWRVYLYLWRLFECRQHEQRLHSTALRCMDPQSDALILSEEDPLSFNRNSVGERTEPCRTPRSKVIELESFLFTCILHFGLVYQEFSSLQALPLIPQSNARLSNSGYWTVLKAFWRSKKQI